MCDHDGVYWEDLALVGALDEEMAKKEWERQKAEREIKEGEDHDGEDQVD